SFQSLTNWHSQCISSSRKDMRHFSMRYTLLALFLSVTAFGASDKHTHSPDLDGLDQSSTVDVIIQLKQPPTSNHHQKVKDHGGQFKEQLDAVKGGHYSVPASQIDSLAADPDVAYI